MDNIIIKGGGGKKKDGAIGSTDLSSNKAIHKSTMNIRIVFRYEQNNFRSTDKK